MAVLVCLSLLFSGRGRLADGGIGIGRRRGNHHKRMQREKEEEGGNSIFIWKSGDRECAKFFSFWFYSGKEKQAGSKLSSVNAEATMGTKSELGKERRGKKGLLETSRGKEGDPREGNDGWWGQNPHEKIRSSRIIPLKYSAIFPFSSEKRGNHVTWARAQNFRVFVMRVL